MKTLEFEAVAVWAARKIREGWTIPQVRAAARELAKLRAAT